MGNTIKSLFTEEEKIDEIEANLTEDLFINYKQDTRDFLVLLQKYSSYK